MCLVLQYCNKNTRAFGEVEVYNKQYVHYTRAAEPEQKIEDGSGSGSTLKRVKQIFKHSLNFANLKYNSIKNVFFPLQYLTSLG